MKLKSLNLGIAVLLSATCASQTQAGFCMIPSWAKGNMSCHIDGRPATMTWRCEEAAPTCDGDICTSTSEVYNVGSFSDNGAAPVPLQLRSGSAGNTLNIRYAGAEPDNWQLIFQPTTQMAVGWTTWRGKRYPLSCWKGAPDLADRCQTYASQAVEQFRTAQQKCNTNPDGRWHSHYDAHYGWCMTAPASAAQSETAARATTLRTCQLIRIPFDARRILPR